MDQTQSAQEDVDIWEFVACAKCQLPFSIDGVSAPIVPFWITECAHVLCNAHLNPDQSCPSCNAKGIELMPLQKEMPPPFSDWFCSLPYKLDTLAQAAKFQQERMAGAARYYKARHEQARAVLNQLKNELAQLKALKKENDVLKSENARLGGGWNSQQQQQQQQHYQIQEAQHRQEPAAYVNVNGKRRIVDNRLLTSSPRSIHTPVGPPRITLPPDHDPPPSLARLGVSDSSSGNGNTQFQQPVGSRTAQPPGSRQNLRQYAYNPPETPQNQLRAQQLLSYEQQAPIRQQIQQNDRRLMPPPPTPSSNRQFGMNTHNQQITRLATPQVPDQMQFGQNPSHIQAQQFSNQGGGQQSHARTSGAGQIQPASQAPRRFVPLSASNSSAQSGGASNGFVPSTPSGAHGRFVPSTSSMGSGRRLVSSSSSGAAQRYAQTGNIGNGTGQRSTFTPSR